MDNHRMDPTHHLTTFIQWENIYDERAISVKKKKSVLLLSLCVEFDGDFGTEGDSTMRYIAHWSLHDRQNPRAQTTSTRF